ncbi:MAG: PKD domain-containing protein [Thermoplasmata archaeon]|nr:PKD domain-containing protein [Thermoplasmata archaeon]
MALVTILVLTTGGTAISSPTLSGAPNSASPLSLTNGLAFSPSLRSSGGTPPISIHNVLTSLAAGQGPAARGPPLSCRAESATQATCGAERPAGRDPRTTPSGGWINAVSSFALPGLPEGAGASIAYDFTDSYFVYFGGCSPAMCPSNQTWIYRDGFWLNDTALASQLGATPPAREWASMDWDGNQRAVLLFGGCGRICPLDDTWQFSAGAWENVTSSSCEPECPIASWGASLAWLPYRAGGIVGFSLLEGGCTDLTCSTRTNDSYTDLGSLNGGWIKVGTGSHHLAPPARSYSSEAYDPLLAGVVLYGGLGTCGANPCGLNDTWEFQPVTGWTEITSNVSSQPPGRQGAAMSWDNVTDSILLFGGWNLSTSSADSDSWALSCSTGSPSSCAWENLTATIGAAPEARYGAAMATNGSGYAPILVGGWQTPSTQFHDMWQFGVPVSSVDYILDPNPTTYGYPTSGDVTASGGTLPYGYAWGFPANDTVVSSDAASTQFTFPTPGTFPVDLTVVDATGMILGTQASVVVAPGPTAAVVASELTTDVGVNDTFTSDVITGTGLAPFQTGWSFGDGLGGLGSPIVHAYSSAGTYPVIANVSDLANHYNTSTAEVLVNPFPVVTANASLESTDVGVADTFAVSVSGGTSPYSFAWWFADGSRATGFGPVHTFTAAGTYTVLVNTTDAAGARLSTPVTVVVHSALTATASASVGTAAVGQTIQFSATGAGGSPAYQYSWHFGDGDLATTASAQHSYGTPGTFAASVTVTDAAGTSVTKNFSEVITPTVGSGSSSSDFFATTAGFVTLLVVVVAVMGLLFFVVWWGRKPPAGAARSASSTRPSAPTEDSQSPNSKTAGPPPPP